MGWWIADAKKNYRRNVEPTSSAPIKTGSPSPNGEEQWKKSFFMRGEAEGNPSCKNLFTFRKFILTDASCLFKEWSSDSIDRRTLDAHYYRSS
jgi:hypothetical protein